MIKLTRLIQICSSLEGLAADRTLRPLVLSTSSLIIDELMHGGEFLAASNRHS